MNKAYNPKEVEDSIYQQWEESGYFNPDNLSGRPYVLLLPPPNITGELHMGHALNALIHDSLIRQKRMQGFKTLWLPGTDHAGIATQNVVEKELKKQGKTRFDLGREQFIKKVWEWKEQYGDIILNQLKRLGASCDWSRTAFTMDETYAKAVNKAFLHYYDQGIIYSGKRPVNWCPRCQTSLSDLELEHKEKNSKLWYIKYPMDKGYITVATTRPETMLGDTGIAVNPNDKRYKNMIGKQAVLTIVNTKIPIVADKIVDPEFGTGAVKVTPAHDIKDYEIGIRHKLEMIQVIDENAKMIKEYKGLGVLEAREKILEYLRKLDLLEKEEDYTIFIPMCYRCNSIVEIIPSQQWFLKMDKLAEKAVKAVKKGDIKFYPKNFEKIFFNWMENIRDWCISRQIWWGHRIPLWHNKEETMYRMGFASDIVEQVLDNKSCTYRLNDYGLKSGDKVAFENSATNEIFGMAKITDVKKTTVDKIDLKDKKHWKTYNNIQELINAFKRHYPKKEINNSTNVWVYEYKFEKCNPIKADQDVLDTWFSSALWPFATLGWPDDMQEFYPSAVLITARDIINLWVGRMIFSGLEFIKEIPFPKVLIYPTVLTKTGQRMSKSLGTGINPLDLVENYGADAVRFGLAWQLTGVQDIRFDEQNIVMARKFCNKLWNASRFVLMKTKNSYNLEFKQQTEADKKVISSLKNTVSLFEKDIDEFRFGQGAERIYHFFWHDFCDIYLEQAKKQMNSNTENILLFVLLNCLKILHPFMPFITEEIYQKLPITKKQFLMIEDWPKL